METQLTKVNPSDFGLDKKKVETIEAAFMPKIIERNGLAKVYDSIITSEITPKLCSDAGTVRKKLVKVRTGIADIHRTQKAFFLAAGRYVDAWKNKETEPVLQMEENLSKIETHFERIEAERIAALKVEREKILSEYCENPELYHCEKLTDSAFDDLVTGFKLARKARIEAEQKAEAERIEAERKAEEARIAKEKAEAEERKRIIAENAKLKAEAEAKEKALAIERAKIESERKKEAEKAAKIAAEKAKLEAAIKAKEQAEKIEAKRKADAEKAAKAAPDKEKLSAFALRIESIEFPELTTDEANEILSNVKILLTKVVTFIYERSDKI